MVVRELAKPVAGLLDYLDAVQDLVTYEVVDGFVFVTPSPSLPHERLSMRVAFALGAAMPSGHEVLTSPLDWVLGPGHVRQPDVMVCRVSDFTHRVVTAPPVLAVEIVSPTSAERDLLVKPDAYGRAGLQHYVVIDPQGDGDAPGTARVYAHDGITLRLVRTVTGDVVDLDAPFAVSLPLRL